MPRTIYSEEHQRLVGLLRDMRTRKHLSQTELARQLGRPQSFVSKYESGQRRLDLVEVSAICHALSTSLVALARRYERG